MYTSTIDFDDTFYKKKVSDLKEKGKKNKHFKIST